MKARKGSGMKTRILNQSSLKEDVIKKKALSLGISLDKTFGVYLDYIGEDPEAMDEARREKLKHAFAAGTKLVMDLSKDTRLNNLLLFEVLTLLYEEVKKFNEEFYSENKSEEAEAREFEERQKDDLGNKIVKGGKVYKMPPPARKRKDAWYKTRAGRRAHI